MNVGKQLVKGALIALSISIFAPQAMASTPEVDPASGEFPIAAVATSGTSVMTTSMNETLECESGTGSGQATSSTKGEGTYKLHGCREQAAATNCTTPGQSGGTIVIGPVTLELVYLDEEHKKPGVLATPPENGVFASFKCAFGLVTIEVKGNGLLSAVTSPKCGESSKAATVVAAASEHGVQEYQQVEETGTKYDTIAYRNGVPRTVGTFWTVKGESAVEGRLTCP